MCNFFTTILLEEQSTGRVHLVQVFFERSPTLNDPTHETLYAGGYCNGGVSVSTSLQKYSYQLPLPLTGPNLLPLHSRNFVNFGYDWVSSPPVVVPENDAVNSQQLSFYVAGINNGNIFVETNN